MELLAIDELENEEKDKDSRCSGRDKNQVPLEHQPDELSLHKHSSTQYLIFTTKVSVHSVSLLHRLSVQHNYDNQDNRVAALSLVARTPHNTRFSPISAQSCYKRVITILDTVQIYYKAFRQKYCFLGSTFFLKCDKLIPKTKDGLASKVPFCLALGQRSSGNSLFCYPPRRKRLLNISSALSTEHHYTLLCSPGLHNNAFIKG